MGEQGYRVSSRLFVAFAVLIVLGVGTAIAVPIADDPNDASGATTGNGDAPGFHGTEIAGDGYIDDQEALVSDHPGPAYVWSTEPTTVNTTLGSGAANEESAVCGEVTDTDGEALSDLGCQSVTPTGDGSSVEFDIDEWPDGYQGGAWITLELRTDDGEMEYYETVPVTVIHPEGDLSGDRLTNADEVRYGTDFTVPDTTGNGLTDWEEVAVHGTDPLATDTSGDGVGDATAVRLGLDPTIPYLPYVYVGAGLLVVLLVVAGGGALGWHFMRRYTGSEGGDGQAEPTTTDDEPAGAGSANDPPTTPPPVDPPTEPDPDGDGPPLTKEEEICRILDEHDGRMKQSRLVDHTEWSQATVSRLLTKLEQEGTVTKLRSGRENIVELRGVESESPDV
ncbi:helix-turn-helix transcriptional regulator [Halalkalicoccus tibetensis]|uniref:Helix-turn-helix transcriptional regulator n=1 Tax=Halalkalicoccus tibetensis TaxID=175632 RepID=A0ABD5V2D8_9EURY